MRAFAVLAVLSSFLRALILAIHTIYDESKGLWSTRHDEITVSWNLIDLAELARRGSYNT
jgi:hypothetical protein